MKIKLSGFDIAQLVLLLITVLAMAFMLMLYVGVFENYDKYTEGKLAINFSNQSTFSYAKTAGLPFGTTLQEVAQYNEKVATIFFDVDDETYRKYRSHGGEGHDGGGTEFDATPPAAIVLEQKVPFVVTIDGSPADAILSAVKYERSGKEVKMLDPVDFRNYFSLHKGILRTKADAPFSLYIEVASKENKKRASFYFEYMTPASAEKMLESLGDQRMSQNKHLLL